MKKQSINKSLNETNINSPATCTYIITAGRVDWLNKDNKQIVLTATSYFFSTNVNSLYFSTTVRAFSCRWHEIQFYVSGSQYYNYPLRAVPLSILTTQHNTIKHFWTLNTQRAAVKQREISDSSNICNYSNGDRLR